MEWMEWIELAVEPRLAVGWEAAEPCRWNGNSDRAFGDSGGRLSTDLRAAELENIASEAKRLIDKARERLPGNHSYAQTNRPSTVRRQRGQVAIPRRNPIGRKEGAKSSESFTTEGHRDWLDLDRYSDTITMGDSVDA